MNKLTLPLSISSLIDAIGDRKDLKSYEVLKLLKEANIKEEDLQEFTDFDHDPI